MIKNYNFSIFFVCFFAFIIIFANCSDKSSQSFIIAEHNRGKELKRKHPFFYSAYNFILDTSGTLFFHNKDSALNCCDTGQDLNFPDYIGLNPTDIQIINDSVFVQYLASVTDKPKNDEFSIQIASFKDTIADRNFFKLVDLIHRNKIENYDVRLITEEEMEVIKAKKENRLYDFYKVNWKSRFSNMLFPPPPPEEESK